jgi:tRNA threonylcarbamoyladenosine modification (KEOPS) complex  Pcc1 subunit
MKSKMNEKVAGSKSQKKAAGSKMHEKSGEKVTGSASLSLSFQSAASSKAAYDALLAEADFSHRGHSRVFLAGKTVRVEIKADDPVSLRASLNSYLRLMHIIKSVEENTD